MGDPIHHVNVFFRCASCKTGDAFYWFSSLRGADTGAEHSQRTGNIREQSRHLMWACSPLSMEQGCHHWSMHRFTMVLLWVTHE
jgi:hypothetical protein